MTYDSTEDRMIDFYDGSYDVPLEMVDTLSECAGSSYSRMDYMTGLAEVEND